MKKIIPFLLLFATLLSLFALSSSATIYSGRALDEAYITGKPPSYEGENDPLDSEAYELANYYQIQFHLDTDTGVLRIYCHPDKNPQKMLPYAQGEWVPWTKSSMSPYIKTVIIEEGVLSVGRFSFMYCENLETVYLPHSILRVDQTTFWECPKLKNIYYAGTREDFAKYVEWQDTRNSYTGGNAEVKARDLVTYGESVTVFCKNQDGEIFQGYSVGGYRAGDEFTIAARDFGEKVTLVSKKSEYTGKFRKGDGREFVFEYHCEHEYQFADPTVACSSKCIHCGCADPSYEDEHKWNVKKDVARGLFTAGELDKTCAMCGLHRSDSGVAYIWYVGAGLGGLVLLTGATLAVVLPIRHHKKKRDMVW